MNILNKLPYNVISNILHYVKNVNANSTLHYDTDKIFSDWIFENHATYSDDGFHLKFKNYNCPYYYKVNLRKESVKSITFINGIFQWNCLMINTAVVDIIFDSCVFNSQVTVDINPKFIKNIIRNITFKNMTFKDDSFFKNQKWTKEWCNVILHFENCVIPDNDEEWIENWIYQSITLDYKNCEYIK